MICELHATHSPANLTVEFHHVVPVAWQLLAQPAVAPFPGKDPDGRGELWDTRGVECCPTGHRNVHFWIMRFMHLMPGEGNDPDRAFAQAGGRASLTRGWATQALRRWVEAGLDLQLLVSAHEWGVA